MAPPPSYDRRYPKVPLDRRAWAFAIDFCVVWLTSAIVGPAFQWILFFLLWLGLRVVVPDRNYGQSLGRWAMDIKIVSPDYNRVPSLAILIKRESLIGALAMIAMIGLQYYNVRNGVATLLLISPLLGDCLMALGDEDYNQAFHDQFVDTIIVQTRRGFSLDLRLKKLLADWRNNVRR